MDRGTPTTARIPSATLEHCMMALMPARATVAEASRG